MIFVAVSAKFSAPFLAIQHKREKLENAKLCNMPQGRRISVMDKLCLVKPQGSRQDEQLIADKLGINRSSAGTCLYSNEMDLHNLAVRA